MHGLERQVSLTRYDLDRTLGHDRALTSSGLHKQDSVGVRRSGSKKWGKRAGAA